MVRSGLLRMLVEGETDWLKDSRDLMMALAPDHDCARRLGWNLTPTPEELRLLAALHVEHAEAEGGDDQD